MAVGGDAAGHTGRSRAGLDCAVRVRDSAPLVGTKARATRCSKLAFGVRPGVAARGNSDPPDFCRVPPNATSATALLLPSHIDCADPERHLDRVAVRALVALESSRSRPGPRTCRDRLSDVARRADSQVCHLCTGNPGGARQSRIQHEHGAGGPGDWRPGDWIRRAEDDRESIRRRVGAGR